MLRRRIGPLGIAAAALATVIAGGILSACDDDGPGDAERFCGEVRDHTAELVTGPATVEDIDGFLALYERIGEVAPLAIAPHWQALSLSFETADSVVPNDPDSLQAAARQAYATERSAVAVKDWLLANCNVDIGPVATIVPAAPPPATSVPAG
ncbi:MAG: hypothetical protein ABW328_17330 [Ilumatobacteraceae bacterium]